MEIAVDQPNYLSQSRLTYRSTSSMVGTKQDNCQSPPYAILPLLPYLRPDWVIWEPAAGEGWLAEALRAVGFTVIATSIEDGQDFYKINPGGWDCIVTNPPWSKKAPWLHRCYTLQKPFCLLYPTDAYGNNAFQIHFNRYGIEILQPESRISYKMPVKGWKGSGAQMNSMWYTWKLDVGREITRLCPIREEKALFKSLENKEDYFEHLRRKYR